MRLRILEAWGDEMCKRIRINWNKILPVLKIAVMLLLSGAFVLFVFPVIILIVSLLFNHGLYWTVYIAASSLGVASLIVLAMIQTKKAVRMAFADPDAKTYERKTDKELHSFVAWSCGTAFLFAVISFQIFIYLAILYWVNYIWFMLMFSRVWQYHGKKLTHLWGILIATTVVSFVAAPVTRYAIFIVLRFFGIMY